VDYRCLFGGAIYLRDAPNTVSTQIVPPYYRTFYIGFFIRVYASTERRKRRGSWHRETRSTEMILAVSTRAMTVAAYYQVHPFTSVPHRAIDSRTLTLFCSRSLQSRRVIPLVLIALLEFLGVCPAAMQCQQSPNNQMVLEPLFMTDLVEKSWG
jgi:hypothetical protein